MQRRHFLRNTLITGLSLPGLVACIGSNNSGNGQTVLPNEPSPREVDPLLAAGRIRTHIFGAYPLAGAAAAHAVLDANQQVGKLLLTVSALADTLPEPPA